MAKATKTRVATPGLVAGIFARFSLSQALSLQPEVQRVGKGNDARLAHGLSSMITGDEDIKNHVYAFTVGFAIPMGQKRGNGIGF